MQKEATASAEENERKALDLRRRDIESRLIRAAQELLENSGTPAAVLHFPQGIIAVGEVDRVTDILTVRRRAT